MSNVTISRAAVGIAPCPAAVVPLTDPVRTDLWVYRGDSGRFELCVTEADGATPIDISTATWDADIRLTATDTTLVASFDVVPVPGRPNVVEIVLTAAESAKLVDPSYVYDVEMTLDGEVTTLIRGAITVEGDVSRP